MSDTSGMINHHDSDNGLWLLKCLSNLSKIGDKIFVFGSNEAGIHGAGAAKDAFCIYGAIWGRGIGHHGQSYGIPTKDGNIETLPLSAIQVHVDNFIDYAIDHPELEFYVTKIGCGLAGYKNEEIAPLFLDASYWDNIELPAEWKPIIMNIKIYGRPG